MVVMMITAFKYDQWWISIFIVLYMYYFIFIANLFVKTYNTENALTKFFFGITEMPLIVAGIMIVGVIVFLKRQYPDANFDSAYLNALVGGITTTIARFKRGKFIKRQV